MAQELEKALDWEPVKGDAISVYPLAGENHPNVSMTVEGVTAKSPFRGIDAYREYNITIEYQPDEVALDDVNFVEKYLTSFEEAKLNQEAIAERIRNDLRLALGLEDIFVEVHCESPANKRTCIGKP